MSFPLTSPMYDSFCWLYPFLPLEVVYEMFYFLINISLRKTSWSQTSLSPIFSHLLSLPLRILSPKKDRLVQGNLCGFLCLHSTAHIRNAMGRCWSKQGQDQESCQKSNGFEGSFQPWDIKRTSKKFVLYTFAKIKCILRCSSWAYGLVLLGDE